MEIDTPRGPARVDVDVPDGAPRYLMVITHGAGGGVEAGDILAVRDAVLRAGGAVARVTQPYRVAGRRMPGAATAAQDEAWQAVVRRLAADSRFAGLPVVLAGRSNGARVACRTAAGLGAAAVVALAFPLHPPGRPERSRAAELREAGVATLVVNGDRDPFGVPDAADATTVLLRPGERHALDRDPEGIAAAVVGWLAARVPSGRSDGA
ncbi:alpha/beta hydrolase family protein [Marinitenerispora sediminis]|uniref:Alpha/beta hydrolase n=1 Tax=Marinitenerispora sediminis TaxID=1931232 RepID=A0A368T796_9ACTN|nr:alpha/beta family hydrolase [Marinitenerispora sediminis]RCV51754.1 alpha/beta hydrolase [Marinitenerispora sediminis]RCV57630.1 alpha/beta hydrolase [Marinitenerispora sediminis]RCV59927.1 alpha/beta hydrolase [Marinitenerispora sediminis]